MVGRDELRYSTKAGRQIRIEVMSAYVLRGGTRLNLTIISGRTGEMYEPTA